MQRHDPSFPAPRKVVVISPNARMVGELEPLINIRLAGIHSGRMSRYPEPSHAADELGNAPAQTVFLDVASDAEQALPLLAALARLPGVQVVAMLASDDPGFILKCLRAGAADFLLQPFTEDQLESALGKIERLQISGDQSPVAQCKMVSVMPAKGACGATTIACNLAFYWKRLGAKRVLLADMDPLTGTMSFLMKLKSAHSFMDVLHRSHELDSDLWKAMVTTVNGVDVLLSPELVTDGPTDTTDPSPILNYARQNYDVVILDSGSVYGDWNLYAARAANDLLLVTTNELPSLQAAQRALSYLETSRVGKWKVRLVVNRYHRDVGLSKEVIGTAMHTDVYETLPSDYEAVQGSLMEGKPVPSATPFGKSLTQLAEHLSGISTPKPVKKQSSGLVGGLLDLFSKKK
ncbi:MAG: AAA family ATPase [Acidobacteriota bacterium]